MTLPQSRHSFPLLPFLTLLLSSPNPLPFFLLTPLSAHAAAAAAAGTPGVVGSPGPSGGGGQKGPQGNPGPPGQRGAAA